MSATLRFLSLLVTACLFAGCSSHAYYNEAMRYMEQTRQVLIEEGLCSNKDDCSRKEMALWSAGGWKVGPLTGGGVSIEVYKVSSTETAAKIVAGCKALHTEIPSVPVTVTVYSNAHRDNLHPGTHAVVRHERIS